jgi:DNA (cytosine-5)-methyltransferase 1
VNVLDLFSGIGGFALGFDREGFQPLAFCEIDAGCRAVLAKHWPHVPIYADVRDHSGLPVSGLVGSRQADRSHGLAEFFDVRPDWIVVENVAHTWKRWVPELRSRLFVAGYASVPLQLSAFEVGAEHLRRRVFVAAHTNSERLRELSRWWSRQGRQVADELAEPWDSAPRRLGTDDGLPDWVDRRKQLGNAVVPYAAQLIAKAIK